MYWKSHYTSVYRIDTTNTEMDNWTEMSEDKFEPILIQVTKSWKNDLFKLFLFNW